MAIKTKRVHLLLLLLANFHVRIGYARENSGGNNQGNGDQIFPDQGGNTDLNNPGNEGQNSGEQPTNPNTRSDLPGDDGISKSNGISDGELTTDLGEFPWMAIIEYLEHGEFLRPTCGGALITNRYVLTAAHCIKQIPPFWQVRSVRLREHNMRNPNEPFMSVGYERIIVHENYNKPEKFRNDIALVRLARNVTITPLVQPIGLPSSDDVRQTYLSAGWGLDIAGHRSDVLVKVPLKLYDFEQCAEKYATERVITLGEGQMCAGGNVEKDTCKGDIGGPLMKSAIQNGTLRMFVHGIGSIGYIPCGSVKWPRVYTKVIDYVPWIKKNIRA